MRDLGTTETGWIHSGLIPGPDVPITLQWAKAIAECHARITSQGWILGTLGDCDPTWGMGFQFSQVQVFENAPLLKVYTEVNGVYSDAEWVGPEQTRRVEGQSSTLLFMDKTALSYAPGDEGKDMCLVKAGTSDSNVSPIFRTTDHVIILAYGK